jgi:ABC-type sugar transport system ATPase subunit
MGIAVEFREVDLTYPGGTRALRVINLSVEAGQCLAVVGPSGAGKTTLLRIAAGLERPTRGELRLDGRTATDRPPWRRNLALVGQSPALFPHWSVFENLAVGLRARGAARNDVDRRVRAAADGLQIGALLGRRPSALSGGQRQRVALGRAIVREAPVWLLDEPFASLDAPLRLGLRRTLDAKRREAGATVLFVTHDLFDAMALGDRLAVLIDGALAQVGPPRDVYEQPASSAVAGVLGDPPMALLPCRVDVEDGRRAVVLEGAPESLSNPEIPAWAIPRDPPARLLLGLRAEHVALCEGHVPAESSHRWVVPVRVETWEPCGIAAIVHLRLAAVELDAHAPASRRVERGEVMQAAIDLARASWFDAATGLRLERADAVRP